MTNKKKTTIEDLTKVIQGGFGKVNKQFEKIDKQFSGVNKQFDEMGRMVQKGFISMEEKMAKKVDVDKQFAEVNERFDKIEKLILADHRQRIEKLEIQVKELRELLAVK